MAFIGKGLGEKKGEGERVVAEFRKVRVKRATT